MAKNRTNRNQEDEQYDVDHGHPGRASENYGKISGDDSKSGSRSDNKSDSKTRDARRDNPGRPKGS
jgi:hypothetical protein